MFDTSLAAASTVSVYVNNLSPIRTLIWICVCADNSDIPSWLDKS